MDHHLKFRLDSLKQASTLLGKTAPARLAPSSTPKLFRPKCTPLPLGHKPAKKPSNPNEPGAPEVPGDTGAPLNQPPEVRKQVKQLQFWLKVFSRFCHDDARSE